MLTWKGFIHLTFPGLHMVLECVRKYADRKFIARGLCKKQNYFSWVE
jgi:hypothetical protein